MNKQLSGLTHSVPSANTVVLWIRTPLYLNSFYLILNQTIVAAIGIVFWLLAAKLYSPESVGLGSSVVSAMMLLMYLSMLGFDYSLIRFLPKAGDSSRDMVNSSLTISGLLSVALAVIFVGGLSYWSPDLLFIREQPVFFAAFVVFTAASTLFMLAGRSCVANRKAGYFLVQGLVFNVLRVVLLIVLSYFFAVFGIVTAWGLGFLGGLTCCVVLFLPRIQSGYHLRIGINTGVTKQMLRFSFANYLVGLFWYAPTFVLPLMVLHILGAESNAYFYIAWSMAIVIFSIPIAISFSLLAEGSHNEGSLLRDTRRSIALAAIIVLPVILMVGLLSSHILGLFSSEYAESGTGVLQLLALSAIPVSLNQIYFGVKRVKRQMKGVLLLSALTAVVTLVMSWVLLPSMGIIGAGLAWLSAQTVASLLAIAMWLTQVRTRRPS